VDVIKSFERASQLKPVSEIVGAHVETVDRNRTGQVKWASIGIHGPCLDLSQHHKHFSVIHQIWEDKKTTMEPSDGPLALVLFRERCDIYGLVLFRVGPSTFVRSGVIFGTDDGRIYAPPEMKEIRLI
jgi:hypothetical protein